MMRYVRRGGRSRDYSLMLVAYGKALSMQERPDEYDDLTSYWGQFVDTRMGKVKHVI